MKTRVTSEGLPKTLTYPYPSGALKCRDRQDKKFWSEGDMSKPQLFGMDKWASGSAKAVTIYEGELDCLSGFQMLGSRYPSVSVRSASSAKADCSFPDNFKWLNGFEKIYLCFDNDEAGERAKRAVASLFDFNRVYELKFPKGEKLDPNVFLSENRDKEFSQYWWSAHRFLPEGVVSSFREFEEILLANNSKECIPYPYRLLDQMTYGIRTSEVVLITALEGRGKTEIIRSLEYHLLKNTMDNIAIIHLEETRQRSLLGLAGYELDTACHLPDIPISTPEIVSALKNLIVSDDRLHVYSHFGSSNPDEILSTIRFLASACECKYIFLDHISLIVSGLTDENERQTLDYLSTKLAMLVEELDFCLFMVSHVNDVGQTRGSRHISKAAHLWIHADRDILNPDANVRNTTSLTINKNRFGGHTGPAGSLFFDMSTHRLFDSETYFDHQMAPLDASCF